MTVNPQHLCTKYLIFSVSIDVKAWIHFLTERFPQRSEYHQFAMKLLQIMKIHMKGNRRRQRLPPKWKPGRF